jgi:cytidylate kinase
MIITISGNIGSGKSTVAKRLAKRLGYPMLDVGALRRAEAKRRGMTLAAFNTWAEKHPKAGDWAFEQKFIRTARAKKNIIVTGRVAYHFLPESFKVFLKVSEQEGARRTLASQKDRPNEIKVGASLTSLMRLHDKRVSSDRKRYRKLYHIDLFKMNQYNFVLDTSRIPIPTVVKRVTAAFRLWQKAQPKKG